MHNKSNVLNKLRWVHPSTSPRALPSIRLSSVGSFCGTFQDKPTLICLALTDIILLIRLVDYYVLKSVLPTFSCTLQYIINYPFKVKVSQALSPARCRQVLNQFKLKVYTHAFTSQGRQAP